MKSMLGEVALSIYRIVTIKLFLNRSVKNLNLAALKDRENEHPAKAARLRFLTDLFKNNFMVTMRYMLKATSPKH